MTKDGYPTAAELKKIRRLAGEFSTNITSKTLNRDPRELIEFLRSIWWMPDWGFKLTGKRILKLELHCGGWSGNESIISELRKTIFWSFYWRVHKAGGHYWFTIDLERFLPKK